MNSNIVTIKPQKGWRSFRVSELWQYRELLLALTLRDIKVRYKQTVLGVAWAVIQPVTTMIIFSILFGRLAKIPSDGFPYPIFVFSGLLAWNFFQTAVTNGGVSLLSAGAMISKVYFPRIIVPLAALGVSIVDFLIALIILFVLMVIYSVPVTIQILFLPIFCFGLMLLAAGMCAWLSSVTVVYRDFRFVIPFALQIWLYLTPVIYPVSFIPENWRWLIYFNPVFGWVSGIRSSILGQAIDWQAVGASSLLTLIVVVLGIYYFAKAERRFADII